MFDFLAAIITYAQAGGYTINWNDIRLCFEAWLAEKIDDTDS